MPTEITVVKRFTYRGNPNEEYSNSYKLTGDTPANPGAWRTLFDQLVAEEKKVYSASVFVIKGYGYDSFAEDRNAVWSVDLRLAPDTPVPGTFIATSGNLAGPGDSAAWVRWDTGRKTATGKRIYLRKYFHPAYTTSNADTLGNDYATRLVQFGLAMRGAAFTPARSITDHLGTIPIAHSASVFSTTRTLKRRGKRNPT